MRSGPRISKRSLLLGAAQRQEPPIRVDRPPADRIALRVLALPGPPQVEHLVGPEVQMVDERLAVRARQGAGEGGRQPQPVRPDLQRRRLRLLRGLADLDHPHLDLGRRPRGQHRIHLVGDEDQLAPHRHLRAYRVGVRRIHLQRVVIDFERERRIAGIGDRHAPELDRRRVGDGHVLEHRLEHRPGRQRDSLAVARRAADDIGRRGRGPGDGHQKQNPKAAHPALQLPARTPTTWQQNQFTPST